MITDAYATVAVPFRRASAAYAGANDMQQLGTGGVSIDDSYFS